MGTGWQGRADTSRVKAAEPGAEYPWVQWVNRGADLDPRRDGGGFFIPVENLALMGEPEFAGAEAATLNFGEGGSSTGVFLSALDISVLATRFAWLTKGDRGGDRGTLSQTYSDGARGKLQALVLLRTDAGWIGPAIITLTGTVTSDFSAAVKTHRQQVIRATSGKGAAPWFWARLEPGNPEKRGHAAATSTVTPILLKSDVDPSTAYVGDEAADWMEENFDVIQAWGAAWKGSVGQTELQTPAEPDFGDEPPPVPNGSYSPVAGQTPMMDAFTRFGATWNRLTQLGCKPANLNNAWDLPTINQATALMEAALRSVQSGANVSSVQLDLLARMAML